MNNKRPLPPGLVYLADNIVTRRNILGTPKEYGARWARDLDLPRNSDTVFFAGCGYQYSGDLEALMSLIRRLDRSIIGAELPMRFANFQKTLGADLAGIYRKVLARGSRGEAQPLVDAVRVLRGLGIDFGYLAEEEPCCGAPLYFAGLRNKFEGNAREAFRKLKEKGVRRIISIVPSCTHALRDLFPSCVEGYDLEVKHFLEVVAENLSGRKLRFPREVKVTYHDPCQLGRYMGLTEEPRRVLGEIKNIQLVEADWTKREWATCCGGGGGFEAVFPELSQMLAVNRARELAGTGADIIVTHCPGCVMQLKEGVRMLKDGKIEVMDLAQVVSMAMED